MSADIRQWQEAEGRTDEQMAELLTDRLGRVISTKGYRMGKARRNPPPDWLHALNIAPVEPSGVPHPPTQDEGQDERPERTTTSLPLPFDPAPVRMQITMAYTFAGKGVGLAMRSERVADQWAFAAPHIADAYIEWAKEDANVARILNTLTLGGPKGTLVMLHVSLLINTLIVSGKLDPTRMVPPPFREAQETDNLADDGSPVVTFEGREDGDAGERDDIPPQPSTKRRTRTRQATST